MVKTLSLCPTCYRKIPATITITDGVVIMSKTCPDHGPTTAVVEKSIEHFSNFYRYGSLGRNNVIIIHAHNSCNMTCKWCYYPMGVEPMHDVEYYNQVLGMYRGNHSLLLSGGEPTLRPDYFKFVAELSKSGWRPSTITNMLKISEPTFFKRTSEDKLFTEDGIYKFAMSMQTPVHYSKEILDKKMKAMENIEKAGLQAMCIMFSITSLDELDWIHQFYTHTKHCYKMLRIRTMFKNWANKGDKNSLFGSDLHKAFLDKFSDVHPIQSEVTEKSNMYCLYLITDDNVGISLSAAPTVDNVDYHLTSRPVFMLAMDGRCYPVPLAQIINEGICLGWKDGFKLETQKQEV